MSRTVHCVKLGKELPGLAKPPYRNELGQRIYENVSEEAWRGWLEHFKMVMNETRMDPSDPRAIPAMFAEVERYFFSGGDVEKPAGYVPEKK